MTTPLGVNEDISKRLLTYIEENKYPENMREMAQTILISSKQVRLHAYNFLDQKLISSERFQANYSLGSVTEAIHEIIEIIQLTLVRKDVVVATDMTFIDDFYPSFLYDRRRLQQVLFALMLNAITYQIEGQKIKVVATIDYEGENDQEFQLCVSVTNEGHEMTPEEIETQFDLGYDGNVIEGQNNSNSL